MKNGGKRHCGTSKGLQVFFLLGLVLHDIEFIIFLSYFDSSRVFSATTPTAAQGIGTMAHKIDVHNVLGVAGLILGSCFPKPL